MFVCTNEYKLFKTGFFLAKFYKLPLMVLLYFNMIDFNSRKLESVTLVSNALPHLPFKVMSLPFDA